jgi:prevent-host-death family protein
MSMRHIQASEVKTHFLKLLNDVENGESIVVTRRGKPIARLVPEPEAQTGNFRDVVAKMAELRKRAKPVSREEILAWRREGHKY